MYQSNAAYTTSSCLNVNLDNPLYDFVSAVRDVKAGYDISLAIQRLLAELTKPECLSLLDGDVAFWEGLRTILCDRYNREPFVFGSVKRLALPGIRFTDGPRGVVMGASTAFPVSVARGATWDLSLEHRIGQAIGVEGKAQGANLFAGVCVNLPRHPAWGRIQETYSEDPLLLGAFGLALTTGVQDHMMACVKHFALNSMENARFQVDVHVDEDVLHEVYLPHFRMITEGGVASVMSSYNAVNGEWAGESKLLLTKILREQWNYDGFVMTDFIFGLRNPVLSVKNGLDIEAPFSQQRHEVLQASLDNQQLRWSEVTRSCTRILRKQLEFYSTQTDDPPGMDRVFSDAHRELARSAAARAMVLLKNTKTQEAPTLPLSAEKLSTVAVIGRLANVSNTGDRGSSAVFSPSVVTPFEGLKQALPQTNVVLEDSDVTSKALCAAKHADAVICVVGYDHSDEGEYVVPSLQQDPALLKLLAPVKTESDQEMYDLLTGQGKNSKTTVGQDGLTVGAGGDRKSLRLRTRDVEIIDALTAVNNKVIVVVIAAGAVIMEEWRDNPAAIVMAWYNGCEGGHALADVLLGKVDASGRLPFSIPTDENHLPFFDINATNIKYDRWHGQHRLDKLQVRAAFPMGFGLSYTTFRISDVVVSPSAQPEHIQVTLHVRNTGPRHGRHHVQIYGHPGLSDFPRRVLMGFGHVDLDAGASTNLTIQASIRPLQRWQNGHFINPSGEIPIEVARWAGGDDEQAVMTTMAL